MAGVVADGYTSLLSPVSSWAGMESGIEEKIMLTSNKLYNGQVEIMFNDDAHIYYKDDKRIPSVTNILQVIAKPALVPWAAKVTAEYIKSKIMAGVPYDELYLNDVFESGKMAHKTQKQSAGSAGTLIHSWIERYIKGEKPEMPVSEEMVRSVEKFLKWVEEYKVEFVACEGAVYSQKYGFTGTFDFIAKINGELVMGDIKTSSGIWTEYWYQVAAYQLARQEEFPQENFAYRGIIRIDRKVGTFQWKQSDPEDYALHVAGFLAAKALYDSLEGMKKKDAI